ncbi:NAD dependent epimerase/dehydratase family protein [Aspergillus steynii IBT 23096]|uniref:NAD dependent epimerase/dehydratase family protein n=1 Tax=Aspergillus steynii IBT 23096 TaxID=1392250 RepID=A0A2I2FUF6_9EURO|nr:NAD dependent epimerase/dehydratase family protein [Aspergillus steynii IBT 23096]PLB44273.1 NAD dependent epimerase/dehydratase family protein [Aspergillus steynii IBT 23096]
MTNKSIFITGASGYIGGSILSNLLRTKEQWATSLHISALVRTEVQAEIVTKLGVSPVMFKSFDELERLEQVGEEYDIIIHAGAGWHTASAKALITGQGRRRQKSRTKVHYFQISGTSNLSDRPHTAGYVNTNLFSDEEDIFSYEKYRESCEVYLQRTTDIAVVETGEAWDVTTYIVMAPTIFGLGSGPINRYSIQLPSLIADALKDGGCSVVETGQTVWSHVHIEDLSTLFVVLVQKIIEDTPIPSGRRGIYFCETGEHTHFEFSERLAKAGFELGLFKSAEVKTISLQLAGDKWAFGNPSRAELAFSSNARTKATIGRQIGWSPSHDGEWESTFHTELREFLKSPPAKRDIPQVLLHKK